MTGNVDSDANYTMLKILSYNVWFRDDLELHMRMEAIGGLIYEHLPDLICFQVWIVLYVQKKCLIPTSTDCVHHLAGGHTRHLQKISKFKLVDDVQVFTITGDGKYEGIFLHAGFLFLSGLALLYPSVSYPAMSVFSSFFQDYHNYLWLNWFK